MPTAHPSGWAHADGALRANRPGGPHWLREPSDPDALVPSLWSQTATKADGVLSVGGVPLPELVSEHGSPAYVLDEADFRSRARAATSMAAVVSRSSRMWSRISSRKRSSSCSSSRSTAVTSTASA